MQFAFLFFLLCTTCGYCGYEVEVLSQSPRILLIRNFLSHKECDKLISLARPTLQRSTVIDNKKAEGRAIDSRRTSEGTYFPVNHKDLKEIEKRLSKLTQIPQQNGEQIQVLHYNIGGEYKPHYDYFDHRTPGGASFLKTGGQRSVTVIMYLHSTSEGGETIFPRLNIAVKPVKGSALLFYNCSSPGVVDQQTLHGGAPVIKGEKWIATKWYREGEYK